MFLDSAIETDRPLTIRTGQMDECEWNGLLGHFGDASFYQTWSFGEVSWGGRQLEHCVVEEDSNPVASAQVRIVRTPVVNAGVAYVRWGPCCQLRGEEWSARRFEQALQALLEQFVSRRGYLLRVIPHVNEQDAYSGPALTCLSRLGFVREENIQPYRSIRVDLTAPAEVIRKRLNGKWRNMLNGAERNDLTVLEGTDDGLYDRFLRLYDEMMDRKQFQTTVDAREFGRIQRALPEAQKMRIMISLKDGVPQTGLVATGVGDTGIYLLGATSNEGMKSKGSYLLQWRMMNALKERGCRWYDLGGINPDENPGVYHFKQGMGGEEIRQLGRFMHPGSLLSNVVVRLGERLRS